MKQHHLAAIALLASLLAACPSNAPVLWLALDGSELKVKLQDHEPQPF